MTNLPTRRSLIAMLAAVAVAPVPTGVAGASAHGITGIGWQAVEIGGEALPEGVSADLLIEADGAAVGRAGCNRFATSATVEGDAITFAVAAATRMMCNETAMKVERAFLAALDATRRFELGADGAELVLLGADGTVLARFAA